MNGVTEILKKYAYIALDIKKSGAFICSRFFSFLFLLNVLRFSKVATVFVAVYFAVALISFVFGDSLMAAGGKRSSGQ